MKHFLKDENISNFSFQIIQYVVYYPQRNLFVVVINAFCILSHYKNIPKVLWQS
jgi:hypothetical protein